MTTDLWLAILHHVLVFALVALLAAELSVVRVGMNADGMAIIARIDAAFGAVSVLVVIAGISRVVFGIKGYAYYLGNGWFWAKMVTFVLIGLLSIVPTLAFLRWRKALKTDGTFAPPAADVERIRKYLQLEALLLAPVVAFAATMARFATG